jgi:hypothetical protein
LLALGRVIRGEQGTFTEGPQVKAQRVQVHDARGDGVTSPRSHSRREVVAWGTYAVIVTAGVVLVLISIASTVRFLPNAPSEFWLLSALALLVELSPLTIPHGRQQPTRLTLSLALTFAIMLLWGPAPAIVVQALALAVAALRQRRELTNVAFDVARFALAFQAAGWAEIRFGEVPTVGMDIDEIGVADVWSCRSSGSSWTTS